MRWRWTEAIGLAILEQPRQDQPEPFEPECANIASQPIHLFPGEGDFLRFESGLLRSLANPVTAICLPWLKDPQTSRRALGDGAAIGAAK